MSSLDTSTLAAEILHGLVLENGRSWGECATGLQRADAEAVLGKPGRHWHGRSRGYSKTSDAAALVIAGVLAGLIPAGERGFFCAADKDQASIAAQAVEGFVRRSGLGGAVVVERDAVKFPAQYVTVEIMSSDAPSAWGRRGWFWVVDEVASWADVPSSRAFWEAISTSWPKVPACRVLVITSAGSPAHFVRREYETALAEDRWRVSDSHDVAPWLDPADIEAERRRLSAGAFARLFENRWTEAEDHLVTSESLARCVTLDDWPLKPTPNTKYVIGVDIGVKNDNTAIAVGHTERRDGERHVVLDALEVYKPGRGAQVPLAEVERRVETLAKRYGRAEVRFDPSQALSMVQALNARRVCVEEQPITARWNDRMTTLLHTSLRDGVIDLPDEPELLDELRNVRVVETSQGLLSVDSTPGRHDDRVDALGIVAMELMARPAVSGKAGSIFSEMPPIPRRHGGLDYLHDRPYNPLTDSPWERARWRRT